MSRKSLPQNQFLASCSEEDISFFFRKIPDCLCCIFHMDNAILSPLLSFASSSLSFRRQRRRQISGYFHRLSGYWQSPPGHRDGWHRSLETGSLFQKASIAPSSRRPQCTVKCFKDISSSRSSAPYSVATQTIPVTPDCSSSQLASIRPSVVPAKRITCFFAMLFLLLLQIASWCHHPFADLYSTGFSNEYCRKHIRRIISQFF